MKKAGAVPKDIFQGLDLTQEEIDLMKEQFFSIDRQKTGFINTFELYSLFEAVGESPSGDKLSQLQSWVEDKASGKKCDLSLALRAWSYLKELNLKEEEDEFDVDILNTFVAMGGNSDKTGTVKKQKLVDIIKTQFGLTIDIEQMFEEAGIDTDKDLEYADFACLLESGGSQRASRICSIFSQASFG
jgi:calmodulin